jgi:Fur family zinc uptake transcriptional regulator
MSATGACAIGATGMAEPRRPPGRVRDMVLRLVEKTGRPVAGAKLAELLREEGLAVPPSMMFRALRQLIDSGAIRKILLARGYACSTTDPMIALVCSRCGAVAEIACAEVFGGLDRLAAAAGFATSRQIVEVPGVCHDCAQHGAAYPRFSKNHA